MAATYIASLVVFFILIRVVPTAAAGGNIFLPSQSLDPLFRAIVKNSDDPGYQSWASQVVTSYRLDRPLIPDQLVAFLGNALTLSFGNSLLSGRSVAWEIMARLPYTLALYVFAVAVPIVAGYYLALAALRFRGRALDLFLTLSTIGSFSVPVWAFAIVVYYFLAYLPKVAWGISIFPLPTRAPSTQILGISDLRYWIWYLSPLYIASLLSFYGIWAYFFRAIASSELGEDYTLTARAKGFSEWDIVRKEVMPSVRPPILTKVAYAIPTIFGGSIALEIVSSWPGIAYYSYGAMINNDYPAMYAFFVISTMLVVISLYTADLVIAAVDPRARRALTTR